MGTTALSSDTNFKLPKYHRFINLLLGKIQSGELKTGEKLPSIINSSTTYDISKDTVFRAYKNLYDKGFLTSIYRKGYFVAVPDSGLPLKKVLLLTGQVNTANCLFYQMLSGLLEDHNVQSDFRVYRNNSERLALFMDEAAGHYHTFIIDPQLFSFDKLAVILKSKVVGDNVILLNDRNDGSEGQHILFDFEQDTFNGLEQLSDRLARYSVLNLLLPATEYFPFKLINGFFKYCDHFCKKGNLIEDFGTVEYGNTYLVIDEKSLFGVLDGIRQNNFEIGKDIGVLALFERPYFQHLSKKITSLNWFNKKLGNHIVAAVKNNNKHSFRAMAELNLRQSL